jgi:hypothetical protein
LRLHSGPVVEADADPGKARLTLPSARTADAMTASLRTRNTLPPIDGFSGNVIVTPFISYVHRCIFITLWHNSCFRCDRDPFRQDLPATGRQSPCRASFSSRACKWATNVSCSGFISTLRRILASPQSAAIAGCRRLKASALTRSVLRKTGSAGSVIPACITRAEAASM